MDNRYEIEKKKIEGKLGFFTHLGVYIIVNGTLLLGDFSFEGLWSNLLPVFGWGIGLISHFLRTFVYNEDYIEKKAKSNIDK